VIGKQSRALILISFSAVVVLILVAHLTRPPTQPQPGAMAPVLDEGERIVFVRAGPQQVSLGNTIFLKNPELFILDDNGNTTELRVDPSGLETTPDLSPDGKSIIFARAPVTQPNQHLLHTVSIDGSRLRALVPCRSNCQDIGPKWSPSGKWIAFYRAREGGTGIHLVRPGEGGKRFLAEVNSFGGLTWGPDSMSIAYSKAGTTFSLHLIDSDGRNARPLLRCRPSACSGYRAPAWAPDGSLIAFVGCCGDSADNDLYLIRPDGTDLEKLLDCPRDCPEGVDSPAWFPDSERIVVVHGPDSKGDLLLIRVSDGSRRLLTDDGRIDCCPTVQSRILDP
jgi:Tol biopolymer transport system component